MAHVTADRIKETTTTTGTGNVTLAGAVSGYLAFSGRLANNDTCYYVISHQSANEWEVGFGTFVSATPALARTTILASSNADAAVNFSAGTKDVFITSPAIAQGHGIIRPTPSANQDNYNPTGLATANRIWLNPSASIKITGLAGGVDGREISIRNISTDFLVWLENENTASSAANRIDLPGSFPYFLMPGDGIRLIYDGVDARWRLEVGNGFREMGLQFFTDFAESHLGGLLGQVAGTGASNQASTYLVGTTEKPMGLCQIDTGTTATGRSSIGSEATGDRTPTLGPALSVVRLAVETTVSGTETFQLLSGFIDSSGGTITDGVAWNNRWTGSAAEWSQDRWSNAVATRSNTGSPTPDNNYIWLIVFVNADWTRADFIYSTDSVAFTKADSPTTGFPGNTRHTAWCAASLIKSAGTTVRSVSIDLAGCRMDHVRA